MESKYLNIIQVDFDEVLNQLNTVWIDYLNKRFGYNTKYEDIKSWDMKKAFPGLTDTHLYEMFNDEYTMSQIPPRDDAMIYLPKLLNEGFNIYVVTACFPAMYPIKANWMNRFFGMDYHHVIPVSNKSMIKGNMLIDDAFHNLENNDIQYKVLFNKPWNSEYDDETIKKNKIIRVDGWEDTYNLIHYIEEYVNEIDYSNKEELKYLFKRYL